MADELVKCSECDREFTAQGLPAHRRIVHGIKGPMTICALCGKPVATSYIKQHRTKYHYGAGEPVPVPKLVDRTVRRGGRVATAAPAPSIVEREVRAVDHGPEFRIRIDGDGVWVHMTVEEFANLLGGYHAD